MAESKKPLMLKRGAEYLERARSAPGDHPPEIKAMAEYVGVSRRLFYKADPEIQQLVSELEDLRELAVEPAALEAENVGYNGLSDTDLAAEIERTTQRAVWATRKFFGQRTRGEPATEASLVAYDLDVCIQQLRKAQKDLHPLVAELQRRELGDPLPRTSPEDENLSLPLMPDRPSPRQPTG